MALVGRLVRAGLARVGVSSRPRPAGRASAVRCSGAAGTDVAVFALG